MILKYIILVFILTSHNDMKIINAYRTFDVNGLSTVFAVENENIILECISNTAMAYCGFIHPNGTRFAFTGAGVNAGHCNLKIKITRNDNGLWKCHIGLKTPGLEIVQQKYVRVADKLAAIQQNITSVHGREVTLHCITAHSMVPLSYCRFESPSGELLSIDPTVTVDKPIMQRYYFPENKSLDRGDCAVTIKKIKYKDAGVWMCGADLEDANIEYTDRIKVVVEGIYAMSTATATSIALGAIPAVIIIVIVAIFIWKKHQSHANEAPIEEAIEVQVLEQIQATPQSSGIPVTDEPPSEPETSPL